MGAPFSDITLYSPTPYSNDTPEYWEETALKNFVSDLYMAKMNGYKPPHTTRVTIQPTYFGIWNRTWKNGSIVAIASEFIYDKYASLSKEDKYRYVLDIIHHSMLQLSEEYGWNSAVFEKAYNEVIESKFQFKQVYPVKQSRDRKKSAQIIIEKTDTVTTVFIFFQVENKGKRVVLLEKRNWWWYDSAYTLAKSTKWFDNGRFGVTYKPYGFSAWYDLAKDKAEFEVRGRLHEDFTMEKLFNF